MAVTKNSYNVSKIKQLIDLNGDSTNFNIHFKVVSRNKEPFDLVVMDQTTLDNTPVLEYQKVQGEISGDVVNDKNVFQSYFLILRSDAPCVCDVEIEKTELPKTEIPVENFQSNEDNIYAAKKINWVKYFLIALGIGIAGVGIYMYLNNKGEKPEKSERRKSTSSSSSDTGNEVINKLKNLDM